MFRLEEPYLCIKVIFVGFSWKFQVKRGKPAISVEIAVEYQYSKWFKVQMMLSTNTES